MMIKAGYKSRIVWDVGVSLEQGKEGGGGNWWDRRGSYYTGVCVCVCLILEFQTLHDC